MTDRTSAQSGVENNAENKAPNNEENTVIELLKSADAVFFPAPDTAALVDLLQRSRRDLGFDPPADYLGFLRLSDGATVDGLMLYGSAAHHVGAAEIPELVEINLRRRAYRDDLDGLIQIGEIDDDIVGFHNGHGRYWRIDRTSGECQEECATLQDLVRSLLRRS